VASSSNVPSRYKHFLEDRTDTDQGQKDISALAEPRIARGVEIFTGNEYYGIDLIVKAFIEVAPTASLKFAIPHALDLPDDGFMNMYGKGTELSTLMYHNRFGLENILNHNVPGFRVKAEHPILLLKELMADLGLIGSNVRSSRTLFFPAHLQEGLRFAQDNYDEVICSKLSSFRTPKNIIDISLPAYDIHIGRHLKYVNEGFTVVSSGHIFDPYFLSRFVNLVTSYSTIATSDLGSHIFYSAALGIKSVFWDFGQPLIQEVVRANSEKQYQHKLDSELKSLFQNDKPIPKNVAEQLLGGSQRNISKSYWQMVHVTSKYRDKYSFMEPKGAGYSFMGPRILRRYLKRQIAKVN
jgi:hypothetical protein